MILPSRLFAYDDFEWLGEHFTLISYDMRNRGRSSRVEDGAWRIAIDKGSQH